MTNYINSLEPKQKKEQKKTVFTHYVTLNKEVEKSKAKPSHYKNVRLLFRDIDYGDVFQVWTDDENNSTLYFGEAGDEFGEID